MGAGTRVGRCDFSPFGREIGRVGLPGCDGMRQKFTGKERDTFVDGTPTGLDYFGARYYSAAQGRFASPDEPLLDQNPEYPQSWNLYSYVRNNPLKYFDPTGEDCVYTNDYNSNGTVGIESGDCSQKGGTFVNGTIDTNSLMVHNGALEFGYTDTNGVVGVHSLNLPNAPDPGILALQRGTQLAAPGVNLAAAGTAVVLGTLATAAAYPIIADVVSAYRAAQAAAALRSAQEAWKRIPIEQRQAAMDWLSKIKPGAPPPGPLPPEANIEALQAYRDIAIKVIQSGKDVVGTQQLRVDAIDKALGK